MVLLARLSSFTYDPNTECSHMRVFRDGTSSSEANHVT
jgi:hypothetical protein